MQNRQSAEVRLLLNIDYLEKGCQVFDICKGQMPLYDHRSPLGRLEPAGT